VLIEDRPNYVRDWADVQFVPGALMALRRLADSKFVIAVVTNQSAIGRGIVTPEVTCSINRRIEGCVREAGGRVDGWYLCPHAPEARCACRKPAPGLLLEAASQLELDLERSYLIGDSLRDLQAARAVGVTPILVLTGHGREHVAQLGQIDLGACLVVEDVAAAVHAILCRDLVGLDEFEYGRGA
jgi:D-glycero-D-manno-heptose 1,7-bisphosphate phosphatase